MYFQYYAKRVFQTVQNDLQYNPASLQQDILTVGGYLKDGLAKETINQKLSLQHQGLDLTLTDSSIDSAVRVLLMLDVGNCAMVLAAGDYFCGRVALCKTSLKVFSRASRY